MRLLHENEDILHVLEALMTLWPSHRAWALHYGIDPGHLSRVLRGKEQVGPQIAAVLGFEPVAAYAMMIPPSQKG